RLHCGNCFDVYHDTAAFELYPLSLPVALPIWRIADLNVSAAWRRSAQVCATASASTRRRSAERLRDGEAAARRRAPRRGRVLISRPRARVRCARETADEVVGERLVGRERDARLRRAEARGSDVVGVLGERSAEEVHTDLLAESRVARDRRAAARVTRHAV